MSLSLLFVCLCSSAFISALEYAYNKIFIYHLLLYLLFIAKIRFVSKLFLSSTNLIYLYAATRTWLEVSKVNETKIKTKQTNKKQNETKLGKSPSGYLVSKGLEISSGNVPHAKSISILFWNVQSCAGFYLGYLRGRSFPPPPPPKKCPAYISHHIEKIIKTRRG